MKILMQNNTYLHLFFFHFHFEFIYTSYIIATK